MGRINNYSKDTEVTANDKWVGSDFENFGRTKNFSPTSIAKYLNDNNVINIGSDLRYRYQTLDPGELRNIGTISFESEIGASVLFSSITTFLLSKRSLKQNDVSQYLQFLNGGSIIINSADNQNLFGFYNITGLSEYVTDTNFYVVTLEYIDGNGSIVEDTDYIFSLITDKYSNETPTQVNSDWNATSGVAEILNKPTIPDVSGFATRTYVDTQDSLKVDKITGKGLSTNDYTTIEKNKLAGIADGAEVNVNADWNSVSGDSQILNKPTIPSISGEVKEINTTGAKSYGGLQTWVDGDMLYLDPLHAGYLTNVKPVAPNHLIVIGYVVYAHAIHGKIFVKVDNGYELDELHNVLITSPANNEGLFYDSALSVWKNETIDSALGYVPFQLPSLTSGSVLFSNGTTIAQDNAAFFWDNTNKSLKLSAALSSNTEAPLIVKNLTAYSAPNYNQYSQLWKNSTDTVIGYFRADGRLYTSNSVNTNYFTGNIAGTNAAPVFSAATGYGVLFPNLNSVAISTASSERLRVTSTGEVVIGETTAGARLDVRAQGASSTDVVFRVRNSADTTNFLTVTGVGDVFNRGQQGVSGNTFFGENVGRNSTGYSSTAFGSGAGLSLTTSINSTFMGSFSGRYTTTGIGNTAFGSSSLEKNNTGFGNTAAGERSLYSNTTGAYNTAIGWESALNITTSNYITAIGMRAARFIADGTTVLTSAGNSIFIGNETRANANSQTNQIVIGDGAIGLGSNTVVLGNNSIVTTALKGNVLIGTTSSLTSAKLQVDSTTQGLLTPRMTTAQKNAISSPATGLIVYDTSLLSLYQYNGTAWTAVGGALQGLDSVLTVGNSSLLDANIGQLGLYDAAGSGYSTILANDKTLYFNDYNGEPILRTDSRNITIFATPTIEATIRTSATATRLYELPDAAGTIALTSDIPAAITLTTTGTSGPATLVGATLNIPQYGGGGGSTPVKLTSQTLTEGSWTLVGSYYTYAFSNVNIDTTCDVSVTPQNASYLTAYNAQVLPFVDVAAGVATFYSQFPPQDDMVVDIVITQTT